MVKVGNYNKFTQNRDLQRQLLDTNQKILVEASPFDKVWGIGLSADNPASRDMRQWKGENKLGKALMAVREQIIFENKQNRRPSTSSAPAGGGMDNGQGVRNLQMGGSLQQAANDTPGVNIRHMNHLITSCASRENI
ncbi:unnamed protein product [Choristocarpus tenellus]